MDAPPGELDEVVQRLFTSELLEHPAVASLARLFGIHEDNAQRAETDDQREFRNARVRIPRTNRKLFDTVRGTILAPSLPSWRRPQLASVGVIEAEENDERSQEVLQNQNSSG